MEQPQTTMTVDEFLAWAGDEPGRHELVDGVRYAMAPERLSHADAKYDAQSALRAAIRRAGVPCFGVADGMTVRIDQRTAYEPDAQVYCGDRLPRGTIEIPEPLIVVEILSPSTGFYDRHDKLAGYLSLRCIQHYLIVNIDRRVLIHHGREGDGIATRILGAGAMFRLDPPGLDLAVDDFLGAA